MAHYGTLRDYQLGTDIDDVRGSDLYGSNDEKLGEIKDVIFDHASGTIRYVVVDTGGWLTSRLFIVPSNRVRPRANDEDDFAVDLTKEQVERFPAYNESIVDRQTEFSDYENRYQTQWDSGPVLHRENSTHIVTPEPEELPAATQDTGALNVTPTRIADKFGDPAPNANKTRLRPAGLAAKAEDQRLPGSSVPAEKPIAAAQREMNREATVPDAERRDTIHGLYDNRPQTTNEAMSQQQDRLSNPDDIYTPAAERNRRFDAFEEHLRRNRVDITARCASCGTAHDKDDKAA